MKNILSWVIPLGSFLLAADLIYCSFVTDKSWKHIAFYLVVAAVALGISIYSLRNRKKQWL